MPTNNDIPEVSVDGLPVIAKGVTGTIYQYHEDQILKIYDAKVPLAEVEKQRQISLSALAQGIPTAQVYELVQCQGQYGVVFEYLKAGTLGEEIGRDREKRLHYATKMGELLRKVHQSKPDARLFPPLDEMVAGNIRRCAEYLSEEQKSEMLGFVSTYPPQKCLLHGDFHENNIMVRDGELVLIDLDSMCIGSPLADFAQTYCSYRMPLPPEVMEQLNLTPEIQQEFLYRFLRGYFPEASEEQIKSYDELFTDVAKYNRFFFPLLTAEPGKEEQTRAYVRSEYPVIQQLMQTLTKRFSILPGGDLIDTGIINMFYFYSIKAKATVDSAAISLSVPIEPEILRQAVEKAMKRNYHFGLTPVLDEQGRVFLKENRMPVAVYPEDGTYCDLGTKDSNGYLFKVFYTEHSIRLEVFHVLTDGRGLDLFLKAIVYHYLTLTGHTINGEGMILTDEVPVDPTEQIALTNTVPIDYQLTKPYRAENVFVIPEEYAHIATPFQKIVDITFPAVQLIAVTKQYRTTPMPLLGAWMNQALRSLYDVGEQTIVISVPVDMREMNHSKALGNYCGSIAIESQAKWADAAIEEQLGDLQAQLAAKAVPEVLYEKLAELKRAENMIRQTPIDSKEAFEALLAKSGEGEARNTYTLTNIGKLRFPKDIEALMMGYDMCGMYSGKGVVLGAYTYGDTGHLLISQNFDSTAIAEKLCAQAKEAGIDAVWQDRGLVRLDSVRPYRFQRI